MPFKSEKQRKYLWANEPIQREVRPRGFNLMLPNKRPITKIY